MASLIADKATLAAIVGGVLAAFGYLFRQAFQDWRQAKRKESERKARLLRLSSLLKASNVVFKTQKKLAEELARTLPSQTLEEAPATSRLDALFTRECSNFTHVQSETFSIIRGITTYALKPINEEMLAWLRTDLDYRIVANRAITGNAVKDSNIVSLATALNQLEVHLILWLAQFNAWMPDERHSLVYLAAEKSTGVGFPSELDELVHDRLTKIGVAVSPSTTV